MSKINILRCLIATEIFLSLLGNVADSGEKFLPSENPQYIAWNAEAVLTTAHVIGLGIGLLFLIGLVVGWVGLWRLWRPARLIYTIWLLFSIPRYLFLGPVVYNTPVGAMLGHYAVLAAGAIFGIIYFSDLSAYFTKAKAEQGTVMPPVTDV